MEDSARRILVVEEVATVPASHIAVYCSPLLMKARLIRGSLLIFSES